MFTPRVSTFNTYHILSYHKRIIKNYLYDTTCKCDKAKVGVDS